VRGTEVDTLAATTLGDACLSTNPRDADATDIAAPCRAAL
jgi:alcohol dehydrogenase